MLIFRGETSPIAFETPLSPRMALGSFTTAGVYLGVGDFFLRVPGAQEIRVLKGGCPRGGDNWGILRIPIGKIRGITTPPFQILLFANVRCLEKVNQKNYSSNGGEFDGEFHPMVDRSSVKNHQTSLQIQVMGKIVPEITHDGSMEGLRYIYLHENPQKYQPNVGKYTIYGPMGN